MLRCYNRLTAAVAAMLLVTIFCSAGNPSWLDPQSRALKFPADTYYTGVWAQELGADSPEIASRKALESARKELIRSISSEINMSTSSSIESRDTDSGYYESESFRQTATETTHAFLVNTSSETFLHPDKTIVTAFVYISKVDLDNFNVSSVEKRISDIRSSFDEVKRMYESGEKKKAHRQSLSLPALFSGIDKNLTMINNIGLSREKYMDYSATLSSLRSDIDRFISKSDHALAVFIQTDEKIGSRRVNIISGHLKKQLSENGCQVVDSSDGADYILSVSASTRESSANSDDIVYAYADVDIQLTNVAQDKHLFQSQFSRKGGGLNIDKASRKALNNVCKEIGQSIIDKIK